MISDFQTKKIYFSRYLKEDKKYQSLFIEIEKILNERNIEFALLNNTKDIWARDFMPIQVSKNKFIEYHYYPDYLRDKGLYRSRPNEVCASIGLKTTKTRIILDGGNVIKSKNKVILTDKIFSENKEHFTENELIEELKNLFEITEIIIIPKDDDDDFGHSDGMIRFINENTVLTHSFYKEYKSEFQEKFYKSLNNNNLNIEEYTFDVKKPSYNNWVYMNFLQTKDIILLPFLGIEEDEQAFEQMKNFFPEYGLRDAIVPVNVQKLITGGGALNCISWTILN